MINNSRLVTILRKVTRLFDTLIHNMSSIDIKGFLYFAKLVPTKIFKWAEYFFEKFIVFGMSGIQIEQNF